MGRRRTLVLLVSSLAFTDLRDFSFGETTKQTRLRSNLQVSWIEFLPFVEETALENPGFAGSECVAPHGVFHVQSEHNPLHLNCAKPGFPLRVFTTTDPCV